MLNIQVSINFFSGKPNRSFIKLYIYLGVKTFVVIADNPKMLRVSMLIKDNIYDIAKSEWLKRALGSDQPLTTLIKLTRNDMLFATDSLEKQFDADSELYDESETPPMEH